jgi:hypothetical protein
MLKLIRNRAGLVLAGLLAALVPMLMAPTGGFPANPTFQSVNVGSTTSTTPSQYFATTNSTHEGSFTALSNSVGAVCITANGSAAAGQCGMPAGKVGIAQIVAPMDFHAGSFQFNEVAFNPAATTPTVCTTSCSAAAIGVGQTFIILKPADTSRASTVTLTNDPDLIFTSVPIGTYQVQFTIQLQSANAGTGWAVGTVCTSCTNSPSLGVQCVWSLSGGNVCGPGGGFAIPQAPAMSLTTLTGGVDNSVTTIPAIVKVTGASTLGLSWAQGASNAGATVMRAQSWYQLIRLL